MKFIIVTGGVMSGLGKGIVTASLGLLMKRMGYKASAVKFDGYLNVDAGTMNPYRHGEVFVLEDGLECDMDLGTYERFLDINLNYYNNPTGGKIFQKVLEKERRGEYLGVDVQMIPHVTGEIKDWVKKVARDSRADIVLVEVGGTVGDIENSYFLEAMRELRMEKGEENVVFIHLTLVPILEVVGEHKTKPTQHSVRKLREIGISPDVIVCRASDYLTEHARGKISSFCNVPLEGVISDPDVKTVYELPLILEKQDLPAYILRKMKLKAQKPKLGEWKKLVKTMLNGHEEITIAMTGKYTALHDSYVSIIEALKHAAARLDCRVNVRWIETTDFDEHELDESVFKDVDGLIVPGGFGSRGTEGKIKCIEYARENNIPFLGLCYGMQLAVIEFARNECGLGKANTTEVNKKTPHPVIDILPEQLGVKDKGGTMRLGAYPAKLKAGTKVWSLYGKKNAISERHRHRYEVNPKYIKTLEKNGLIFSGYSPDRRKMEFLELPKHPYFVATQAHPEFKSRPMHPSPPFIGLIKAAKEHKK